MANSKLPKLVYDDLLDKPFRLGARGPAFYDCWGLCMELGRRAGIIYPEYFTPADECERKRTEEQSKTIKTGIREHMVKIEKPEPYCVVVFSLTMPPPLVDHCGFVLEDCRKFVHILRQHKVAVLRLSNKILKPKIDGYYKLWK